MRIHVVWPKKIGPVTARTADGAFSVYGSLKAAVADLGPYWLHLSFDGVSVVRGTSWLPAVTINFYDCYGHFIEPAAVMDCVEAVLAERAAKRVTFRRWRLVAGRDFEFRNGPVPFTGKRSGGSYFRRMRTTQERREAAGLAADREMAECGVRHRARRSVAGLTNAWDDVPRDRDDRSWKSNRRTRWKS